MNRSFDWLRRECEQIQSQRFHIFETLKQEDYFFKCASGTVELQGDYADFLREFGWGKFFSDYGDVPTLSVYPLKEYRKHTFADGHSYIGFADRGQKSFCFHEKEVIAGKPSKVFLIKGKMVNEVNSSFSDWIKSSYEWVRARYSAAQWKKVMDGPKPFTSEELAIVEARSQFQ